MTALPRRGGRGRGPARLVAALLAVLVVVAPFALATPARAAGDSIDSYALDYVVGTDGTVAVTERLVYRFGTSSGRHGIQRQLVAREPEKDDPRQDVVYRYDNIQVSSPDAPAAVTTSTVTSSTDPRREDLLIRVGDPNRTVTSATATYQLTYTITGAMRGQQAYDEFYWDAVGTGWTTTTLNDIAVSVTVPGGATDKACYAGGSQSNAPCDSVSIDNGVLHAAQSTLGPGEGMTVSAQIRSGLVSDNRPHLAPSASVQQQRGLIAAGGVTALVAALSALVGARIVRSRRDLRFLDLPPGVLPPPGAEGRVGASPRDLTVPVAFAPPPITVAEAGYLLDGTLDTRETAATLIALAVRGAVTISGDERSGYRITLVDRRRAEANHEAALLWSLFAADEAGATVDLGQRGGMTAAHDRMVTDVRREVGERGWFVRLPRVPGGGIHVSGFSRGWLVLAAGGAFVGAAGVARLLFLLPLLPIIVAAVVVRRRLRRGQRTPVGRALTDQTEGFREYLATAEADQLRFEEGEDIFSRYLPWAISFDLADRWARVCQDLVAAGRLPEIQPTWYIGQFYLPTFSWIGFTDAVASTVAPLPPVSSGDTGFGSGGSAFGGGGGFVGGGGGGGGGGSW
ncbi:DUF2207 domain-containing protein [Raineyella sp. LH-20]|uniref:DUF2207 domain-containing protein n=1 Tax=Raineyella sp. LH-20 TaxID=3081204 RepID=UPI0029537886|nr:DUF2207 domain-containing protein [Raineyella sp. LH-20]WOP17858.1 DUF2207 domain-containing protein [Raineyella sp. LH-20]